ADTIGETYLAKRGIGRGVPEGRGRFQPAAQDGKPCVVYAVTDKAGEVVAVQRVPLLADGSDRDRAAGKKSLGPISAGFFVLADPHPCQTIVCEGPEDALAIRFAAHEDITAPDVRVVDARRRSKRAPEFLCGGQVATVMLAAARLGLRSGYQGAVGEDLTADQALAPLLAADVAARRTQPPARYPGPAKWSWPTGTWWRRPIRWRPRRDWISCAGAAAPSTPRSPCR
ncbi:MAG: hypothetical protein IH926_09820, partial [Proteobacteria bacterium]|nr:hypothetical protein [Pseudomonadota bacterium]